MAIAEFEEREYELQFNLELAAGKLGTVWTAGQVLEAIVGYDGVADPDVNHVVWQVLNVQRPKGVVLVPQHWGTGRRPTSRDLMSTPVSLVLQYKRPDYLYGAQAAQWRLWGRPYFRFRRSTKQHNVLKHLENQLGAAAVVRYACPAFWRRGDLESNSVAGRVISESGFVSPAGLGTHQVWTYIGPGVSGLGNPSARRARFESDVELQQVLSEGVGGRALPAVRENNFLRHSTALTELVIYRRPRLRKQLELFADELTKADLPLSEYSLRSIVGLAAITTLTRQIGASWHLVRRHER